MLLNLNNVCTNCQMVSVNGVSVVFSYGTQVLSIDRDGKLHRLWSGWSVTTQKHINKVLSLCGLPSINKAAWEKMPVETLE